MSWLGTAAAVGLIGIVLLDTFEAMILPRRVRHSYRLARIFYAWAWRTWKVLASLFPVGRWRSAFLSVLDRKSVV